MPPLARLSLVDDTRRVGRSDDVPKPPIGETTKTPARSERPRGYPPVAIDEESARLVAEMSSRANRTAGDP